MLVLQKLPRYNTKINYHIKIINKNQIGYHGVIEDYYVRNNKPLYSYKCFYNGRIIATFDSFIDDEPHDSIHYIYFAIYNDPLFKNTEMHRYHNKKYQTYNEIEHIFDADVYYMSYYEPSKIRHGIYKHYTDNAWFISNQLRLSLEKRLKLPSRIPKLYLSYRWPKPLGDRQTLDLVL